MLKHPRVKALGEIGKDNNVVILFSSWVSEINKIWKSKCGYFAQCDVTALVTLHLYALATGYESNHWVCKHSIIRCLSSETVLVLNMVLSDCLLNQPERIIVVQLTFLPKMSVIYHWKGLFATFFGFIGRGKMQDCKDKTVDSSTGRDRVSSPVDCSTGRDRVSSPVDCSTGRDRVSSPVDSCRTSWIKVIKCSDKLFWLYV